MLPRRCPYLCASLLMLLNGVCHGAKPLDPWRDCGVGQGGAVAAMENRCRGAAVTAATFIQEAYGSISEDLARGGGPYSEALFSTYGCHSRLWPELTEALRTDLAIQVTQADYARQDPEQRARHLYRQVRARLNRLNHPDCKAQ